MGYVSGLFGVPHIIFGLKAFQSRNTSNMPLNVVPENRDTCEPYQDTLQKLLQGS
jgi:hypothetical protein